MGPPGRAIALAVAAALAVVLGVAAWLTPDARGYGTHRQLGMPPCTFHEVTGVICPSCGMTTSFCHFVRGQWLSAYRANPLGLLLAAGTTAAIPWLVLSAWRGRMLGVRNGEVWAARIVGGLLVLLFVAWGVRLAAQWWTEGTIFAP